MGIVARLIVRMTLGLVLALAVLLGGYPGGGGKDGPCAPYASFAQSLNHPGVLRLEAEHSAVPLFGRCNAFASGGRPVASTEFPPHRYRAYAAIALVAPLVLLPMYRRVRPRRKSRLEERLFPRVDWTSKP